MSLNEILTSLEIGIIYGIVAIGIYLTFRIINFPDLTCDGSFVLGAAISSILIKLEYNPWLTIFITLLSGGASGAITGVLYIKFKVTDLLSGILVTFMLYSVNLRIMGGVPNITFFDNNTIFTTTPIFILVAIALIIYMVITYLLMTDFGLALRSIGQNKKLAQNKGVDVPFITIVGLAISNALVALGGALFSQYHGFTDIGSGVGTLIIGLASIMVGEKLLPYKSITIKVISCLLGSIVYRLFISFALHTDAIGLTTQDLNLIIGIMIIPIMYLSRIPYAKP